MNPARPLMIMNASSFLIAPQQAEGPIILAIDVGTSSIRTALFDRLGRMLQQMEARRSFELHSTPSGASEADPDRLLALIGECVDQTLAQAGSLRSEIAGVASCTFVSNILGVDPTHRAVTPLTTYADTRASFEAEELKKELDEAAVHDRTGCHFHPSYLPARFRWISRHHPEWFRQVKRWVSIGEYLELTLFGQTAASYSVASWTGLLDRFRLTWDAGILAALPIQGNQLSPLTDGSFPRHGLLPAYARRWPELKDIPWFPTIGDGAAANIGSGCISPRRVAVTMGTSSAVRIVTDQIVPQIPAGLWCYRVDGRRSLLGGALNEGGSVYAWLNAVMDFKKYADLEKALLEMEPDSHGLTVLPFWAGERSPGWAGHARATIHGLTMSTTPLQILRAGLEAVAYRIGLIFALLHSYLPSDGQVIGSGRAILQSPAWAGILADVLAKPIVLSAVEEASARGAALLALEALGALANLDDAPVFIRGVHRPDLRHYARYRQGMDRQKILYEKLVKGGV